MNAAPWIAIFALGLLGLSWPILEIFHAGVYLYLLTFWLLFVLLVACAARAQRPPPPR